jgi:transcriptional regulator with XRE-family HTH domain
MPIGERLREERERLGLTQPNFASIASTTKQTLFSWESGKTAPDGFQMARLSEAGVDVLYVLTGQRDRPVLTAEEQTLLSYYRRATSERRDAALGALIGASQAQSVTMTNSASGSVQVGYVQGRARVVTKRK